METKNKISLFIKGIIFAVCILFAASISYPQSSYNSFIDTIISKVSLQSISMFDRQLSGDTSALIGGVPYTIISRYWEHEGNIKAAQYIYEKFQSLGYQPQYDTYSVTGMNVLAKKTGVKYPNQYFIICAHYDDGPLIAPPFSDTVPGADDNASGISAVLEAARLLKTLTLDYTVLFAAWDEEERWMYGSGAYADSAFSRGDSIMAVFNLDMIGWDGNDDHVYRIFTDSHSIPFAYLFADAGLTYQPFLVPRITDAGASDHIPFQEKGYYAICGIENSPDFNPYYHTVNDRFIYFNLPYFLGLVKTAIAALLVSQSATVMNLSHVPLESTFDTTSRIASVTITSNRGIGFGGPGKIPNDSKLFFRVGSGNFSHLIAYYHHLDTFKFLIPGQSPGSTVSYYFAAQDSLGTTVSSLPYGAKGINPPGTIPPPSFFSYSILRQGNFCSNTLPKSILPMVITYDTINIPSAGNIYDYDLNLTIYHTRDSSLYIRLLRPGVTMIQLSMANGGSGENYFNTTFDDEAEIPITQGVPPFIGSYRPEELLNTFDNSGMEGLWILSIFNYSQTITGQLTNWCLSFDYSDPIGITNNQLPVKYSLSQNYPNPFNSSTRINFTLPKQSHVRIVVYDVLGREVKILVNDLFNYGKHNLSYDANNLASGLYFYSMYLDGNMFETKKMVLIK